jgi:hypothetical protein
VGEESISVFAVVASVIFWRRLEDPMALLVATMLVVWGLEGFSARLRDQTDLEALNHDLVGVVRETIATCPHLAVVAS